MDEQPDPIAALDQLRRGMQDVASIVHAYFRELVVAGFREDQALVLAVAYRTAVVQLSKGEPSD